MKSYENDNTPDFTNKDKALIGFGASLLFLGGIAVGCDVGKMDSSIKPNNCRGSQNIYVTEGTSLRDTAEQLQQQVSGTNGEIEIALRLMNPGSIDYKKVGTKKVYYFTESGKKKVPIICSTPNPKPQN